MWSREVKESIPATCMSVGSQSARCMKAELLRPRSEGGNAPPPNGTEELNVSVRRQTGSLSMLSSPMAARTRTPP